jgi:DNA-binding MarR family transcriptional regulator
MEMLLIEFINTLDLTLIKLHEEAGDGLGISNLTINQFRYIDAINDLGQPTITQIAEKLNITKASVTTGINKLTEMGYVIKTQSISDKRVIHLSLTEASNILVIAKYNALKEYGEFIQSALNEEETRLFKDILSKLVKLFENKNTI